MSRLHKEITSFIQKHKDRESQRAKASANAKANTRASTRTKTRAKAKAKAKTIVIVPKSDNNKHFVRNTKKRFWQKLHTFGFRVAYNSRPDGDCFYKSILFACNDLFKDVSNFQKRISTLRLKVANEMLKDNFLRMSYVLKYPHLQTDDEIRNQIYSKGNLADEEEILACARFIKRGVRIYYSDKKPNNFYKCNNANKCEKVVNLGFFQCCPEDETVGHFVVLQKIKD